jgi:hypothetical protein
MYSLDKTLIDKFRKAIQEEIEQDRFGLSKGYVEDILDYKKTCARIEGLELALARFNELVKRLGDDDNDEK